ncbi:MAG: CocE/NonD family hydrolase [Bacteroidales bacterium]|nr:CocE/NonD family hydrolase [Bacteroidales bacterium]
MKRVLLLTLTLGTLLEVKAQWAKIDSTLLVVKPRFEVQYVDTLIDFGTGMKLRTQMCLPVTSEAFPVVLTRNPYVPVQMTLSQMGAPRQYAERGIGYVLNHPRGTGGSEGQFQPNIYEREDGLAVVGWLDRQPWITAIGLTGTSYMSLTCWIIADSLPDKVKCIHQHHYGVDRHLSAYNSGLFRQDILTAWSISNAREPIKKPKVNPEAPYYVEERYMPQVHMDVDLLGCELPWYRDWITHTDYTDPYWHQGVWETLRSIPPLIKVPCTIVAGHFDHHNEGTLLGYQLLSDATKAKSRLIVGAWNHSFVTTPTAHHPQHDKDFNVDADAFNWMYALLVEGKEPEHEVLVYNIGEDEWRHFDQWPVDAERYKAYYLTSISDVADVRAYHLVTDASLLPHKDEQHYIYDPENPVISVGGETLFTSERTRGSIQQPEVGYRPDVLSYLSDPLDEDLNIDGKIRAVVWMNTDVDDTALTFKVSEVLPDGTAYNIRSGITTMAYRNNRLGTRQTYSPDEVVELTIEALPILWQIKKGHRLRIDITSSNFPEYSIHSNYAGIWSLQTKTRVAHQTLFVDALHPSRIEIPCSNPSLTTK